MTVHIVTASIRHVRRNAKHAAALKEKSSHLITMDLFSQRKTFLEPQLNENFKLMLTRKPTAKSLAIEPSRYTQSRGIIPMLQEK